MPMAFFLSLWGQKGHVSIILPTHFHAYMLLGGMAIHLHLLQQQRILQMTSRPLKAGMEMETDSAAAASERVSAVPSRVAEREWDGRRWQIFAQEEK